ncbi:hypothetical protein O0L34_g10919 [Tuta absoluta]|nr:hypothetical protein O0L34_g10919 [Tuta absoluta]
MPPSPVLKEDVKILRIPGFNQALLRLVPRVPVAAPIQERIVQMDPLALIGSYLGIKSAEETILAMQNMKQLMQSDVMRARQEVIEVAPPSPPVYMMEPQIVQQMLCPEPRPVYPFFERNVLPMPVASPCLPAPIPAFPPVPIVPASAKLMPAPPKIVVSEEIRPAYSYIPGYPGASLAFVK